MQKKLSVALIATDWSTCEERKVNDWYGGVTYYRLIKPLLEMQSDEYEFKYYGAKLKDLAMGKTIAEFWDWFTDQHDVFVIKHVDNPEPASHLLFFCQKKGKKVILDMDDNLFEIKPDQPAWELYKSGTEKRAFVSALISLVDGMFVSTEPLRKYYADYIKTVHGKEIPMFVLPNFNDVTEFPPQNVVWDDSKIVIGWMGSTTHFNDLKEAIPAVARIMKEYPNVHFVLTGGVEHTMAGELFKNVQDDLLDRVFVGSGTQSWHGYPKFLSEQQIDIGIAPLTQDEFNRGKSHIKWLEYSMYEVPTVASRVYPYQMDVLDKKTIQDGVTGFLCDKKEWYKTLKKLVENKELRKKIGKQAKEYIVENYQYKDHIHLWEKALSTIVWE